MLRKRWRRCDDLKKASKGLHNGRAGLEEINGIGVSWHKMMLELVWQYMLRASATGMAIEATHSNCGILGRGIHHFDGGEDSLHTILEN